MIIYPNPSRGEVKLRMLGGMEVWGHGSGVEVDVINSTGMTVKTLNLDPSSGELTIDLGDQPDGIYIVRITSDDHSIQKKISLFK